MQQDESPENPTQEKQTQEFPAVDLYLDVEDELDEITKPTKPVEFIDEDAYRDFSENIYILERKKRLNVSTFLNSLLEYLKVSEGLVGSFLIMYIFARSEGLFAKGYEHRYFYKYYKYKKSELSRKYKSCERTMSQYDYLVSEYKSIVDSDEALQDEINKHTDDIIEYLWSGFRYISENLVEQ